MTDIQNPPTEYPSDWDDVEMQSFRVNRAKVIQQAADDEACRPLVEQILRARPGASPTSLTSTPSYPTDWGYHEQENHHS